MVVLGLGGGIEGSSMWLCGFNACAGGNVNALGAGGGGGIQGGAGRVGIRVLGVGGESNVGAARGARSSPGIVTGEWWWRSVAT